MCVIFFEFSIVFRNIIVFNIHVLICCVNNGNSLPFIVGFDYDLSVVFLSFASIFFCSNHVLFHSLVEWYV